MDLKGKIILITGGTGSFGNALVKKIINTDIKEIRILSRDEKKQDDMRNLYQSDKLKFYIGDVRDYLSICNAFKNVDYVFHAAALKQVPSCEFFPMEAIKTNVIGSDNVISASLQNGVKKVVFLSTDKAAYPINAMGMSKALMEKNVIARSRDLTDKETILCLTRYGNVMGSRGSVIPLFYQEIEKGYDLTVTDPNMSRFMMSLDEAVSLVLYAFEHGRQGDLFIQKSPAITLDKLAKACIKYKNSNVNIKIIGTRHGEKLYETLITREEMVRATDLGNYYCVSADKRNLNYDLYFNEGNTKIDNSMEYTSSNTTQLSIDEMIKMLRKIGE